MGCDTITAIQAAKLFEVDRSTVSKWLQDWLAPAIVEEARGRKSARLCKATVLVAVRLRREQRRLDPQQERAQLDRERRTKLEIENAVRRGDLVEAERWVRLWEQVIVTFRDGVLAVPGAVGGRVVRAAELGENEVVGILDEALRKELETLSRAEAPALPPAEDDPQPAKKTKRKASRKQKAKRKTVKKKAKRKAKKKTAKKARKR